MFIDASAIVAILNREPGYEEIVKRIEDQKRGRYVSPLVRFEATAALARSRSGVTRPDFNQHELAEQIVETFCDEIEARNIDITRAIGQRANLAARTYGKMVGHKADLNFGDCFAYACAQAYNSRLIYKGDDFAKTDMA
ncbi:type II toxin-antitoxin system VapC family toxin [Ruegeria meonggei]|uniref:type II toxin-antitoxin system VapC family toxin n=1 Tax=Ruegeria meonggei TaxID=1446476 RepID=UPI00366BC76A